MHRNKKYWREWSETANDMSRKEENTMCMEKKEFTCYSVGEKYDKVMGGDGAVFEVADGQCIATVGLTDIADAELALLESAPLDCFLSVIDEIIFVNFVFGRKMIFNMPFNACLYAEFTLKNKYPYGYFVPVIVVENRTNIIKAMRVIGCDNEFSLSFFKLCEAQRKGKIENYDRRLQKVYDTYSETEILKSSFIANKLGEM